MEEITATLNLDSDAAMNLPATDLDQDRAPRGGANRFTYPSGSRPLGGFTIKRGIGHGGFGEVYYATSDAGKEVALKLIRRNLNIELRGVMQCLNLKHPNLVALYDIKHDATDDTWVVMEYVAGEQLEDVVARAPQGLPRDKALAWMHGICGGVAYLHDRGIVHRDLKPGNIFNDEGLVKIGDYGLSKFISASRRSGQTESVGTVHYMAPEVANGRYGKEIDIYALGIILYELLTGRVPFEGESIGEVLMKHLTAQPDLDALEAPYRAIVERALEKDPQNRLASVAELIALLPPPPAGTPRVQPTLLAEGPGDDPLAATTPFPPQADAGRAQAPFNAVPLPPLAASADESVLLPGEPVWASIRDAGVRTWRAWYDSDLGLLPKLIILFFGLLGVLVMSAPLLGILSVLAAFYIVYLVFWLLTVPGAKLFGQRIGAPIGWPTRGHPAASPTPPPASTPPGAPAGKFRDWSRQWHERHAEWHRRHGQQFVQLDRPRPSAPSAAPAALPSMRERTTDLLGSLLTSAVVSAAAMLLVLIIRRDLPVEQLVAMGIVSTLGAWAVLIPSKFWEGRQGEPIIRRLVLFVGGLAVGAAAFGIAQALMLEPHYSGSEPPGVAPRLFPNAGIGFFASPRGELLLPMYLAYFGFLFPVLRWWKQADPERKQRMSLWATAICVAWAGILGRFWEFPQPQGMLVAGTTSLAIQLASPWVGRRPRAARAA